MLNYLKQELAYHFIFWEIHPFVPAAICADDDECPSERTSTVFCVVCSCTGLLWYRQN